MYSKTKFIIYKDVYTLMLKGIAEKHENLMTERNAYRMNRFLFE